MDLTGIVVQRTHLVVLVRVIAIGTTSVMETSCVDATTVPASLETNLEESVWKRNGLPPKIAAKAAKIPIVSAPVYVTQYQLIYI